MERGLVLPEIREDPRQDWVQEKIRQLRFSAHVCLSLLAQGRNNQSAASSARAPGYRHDGVHVWRHRSEEHGEDNALRLLKSRQIKKTQSHRFQPGNLEAVCVPSQHHKY